VLGGVWLSYFGFGLTAVTLAPLVAQISADLSLSTSQIGTVMGAWQLIYIGSAIPCGIILERLGVRKAMLLAFIIIALSCALRGMATSYLELFLAVAIFGLGGPLVSIGAPKIISLWFDGKDRGFAMGVYMTGMALGSMAGLSMTHSIMMPLLNDHWRHVLFAYSGFVFLTAFIWLLITSSGIFRDHEKSLNGNNHESQLTAFLNLVRIPSVCIVLLMGVGIFFFGHGLNNWLPEILIFHGMDSVSAGFWASGPTLVGIVASLVIPRLATPQWRVKVLFGLFVAALLATLFLQNSDGFMLAIAVVMQGVAKGAMMTVAILILLDMPEVGPTRTGLAGGLFFSTAEIGGVLGPVSIGILSDYTGGFSASLWMLSGICISLLVLLASFRITRKPVC